MCGPEPNQDVTASELGAQRAYWDRAFVEEHRYAVWPRTDGDYDEHVEACLDEIIPALGSRLELEGARVLDLGCGVGRLAIPLASLYPQAQFVGVDISKQMVVAATEESVRLGVWNVEFRLCNGYTLPTNEPYDAAFSVVTLQHIPPMIQSLYVHQIGQVLRSGGVFRFQYVVGSEDVFLSHGNSPEQVQGWCENARLRITEQGGGMYPNWRWVSAVKS